MDSNFGALLKQVVAFITPPVPKIVYKMDLVFPFGTIAVLSPGVVEGQSGKLRRGEAVVSPVTGTASDTGLAVMPKQVVTCGAGPGVGGPGVGATDVLVGPRLFGMGLRAALGP